MFTDIVWHGTLMLAWAPPVIKKTKIMVDEDKWIIWVVYFNIGAYVLNI